MQRQGHQRLAEVVDSDVEGELPCVEHMLSESLKLSGDEPFGNEPPQVLFGEIQVFTIR